MKGQRKAVGIEDVDPYSPEMGRVSSPNTLQAMKQLGIELSDLVFIPKAEFQKLLLNKDLIDQRFSHHEGKRIGYIQEVRQARSRLLDNPSLSPVSPRPSERDLKQKAITPVKEMEQRERKLLQKLQIHKEKVLEQILTSESRQQQLLQDLEDSKQREILKEKQRLESIQKKHQTILSQKRDFETKLAKKLRNDAEILFWETKQKQISEKTNSPGPNSDQKLDSFDRKLREIQQKLEKRSFDRQKAKEELLSPVNRSEILDQSLAKRMKVLETEENLLQMQSEHSFELEEKFKKHEEKMRELKVMREKRQNERQKQAEIKAERIKSVEKEKERKMEEVRKQLFNREMTAEVRFGEFMRKKEDHISEFVRKETVKQAESDKKRKIMRENEQKKAESVLAEIEGADKKVEIVRAERAKEWAIRKEALAEKRTDRYKQAVRLRKIEEYQRLQTLQQIQAENDYLSHLKATKDYEQYLKQKLRKELESERKLITEKFDRLAVSRSSKVMQSLQTQRAASMSPERTRDVAVTPSAAPEPRNLNRSESNATLDGVDSKLEEAKVRHDRELMELLRLENERERERGKQLADAEDEEAAKDLENKFQKERKEANRRIMELSEKQAEYEKKLEKGGNVPS